MDKARVASVLSVVALLLAIGAAVLNYANNGRVTWKAVAGVAIFASVAIALRSAGRRT
jgi:membrane protein YdbS with pleckstrin-like domain